MKQTFDRNTFSRGLLMMALGASLVACSPNESAESNPAAVEASTASAIEPASPVPPAAEVAQGNDEFAVTGAWVRAAPPGAMMLAGYFTLNKRQGGTRRLVGARSDAFGDVSIHRSFVEDGVSKMRPAGALDVNPDESLVFEPGGLHLMLMSPKVDVSKGQRLPIWLCFEDGDDIEEIEIEFEVRAEAGGEGNAG
ncbi:MAG: copper chaperone PCu(A)C [Rhodanobacteraceae bacterium]|nr:copper chaperone PCu(A)C [Xanthomonadales bacterium]MCP5478543.1 copper chaperone PCu(A)C [Rhodanobacteraceae bacterium]HPF73243.1 copper chaperone PCu(A)C [Xanthomonadaceae bacterium]HRX99866.1 copper chaperone PCu(A)C [Xanthomonadaceae bacterium]